MKLKSVSERKKKLDMESDGKKIHVLIAILLLFIVSELPMPIFYILFLFNRSKYYIAKTSFYTFPITTNLCDASLNIIGNVGKISINFHGNIHRSNQNLYNRH